MFNPYSQWLGLPAELAKPNYFHILRIKADVTDPETIAKAAQKATLKVRSAKPGDRMLEWTQLIAEIETARMVLSDAETRKAYIKQLLAEKKAREQAEANAVASSAFVEEEAEAAEFEEDQPEEEAAEEDDPMAAWSAAYGGAKPARSSGSPAVAVKGAGPKKSGPQAIGPKGAAAAPEPEEGPIKIRKAVKGRRKPGAAAYVAIAVLFLLAIAGAAFGGVYAFKMLDEKKGPEPGPQIAANQNPRTNPNPAPAPAPAPAPGPVAPTPTGVSEGGFATPTAVSEQENSVEPPATGSSDPFTAAVPAEDPELAAMAAEDDPFYVEPTLQKFGYSYDPDAAVSVATPATTPETSPMPAPMPSGRELTEEERTEVDAALAEIREMLVRREVPQAEQRIAALATKFEGTHASDKIEAVRVLTQKFREFWIAVVRGAMKTPTGTPLDYEGVPFSLVEASAQLVVVRAGGENKRWAPVALPGGLAKYFAESDLDPNVWNSDVVLGTIYALENDGAKADKARELWEGAVAGDPELEATVQQLLPLLSVDGWKAP